MHSNLESNLESDTDSNSNTNTDAGNDIPESLRAPATAALNWINSTRTQPSELTGLVDYESALQAAPGESFEMGLVLCDGNSCDREQVLVTPVAGTPIAGTTVDSRYEFSLVAQAPREIPTLLDPPVGVRQNWLDTVLAKHDFVLLLFYRGLW